MKLRNINRGLVLGGVLALGVVCYSVYDNNQFKTSKPEIEQTMRAYIADLTSANVGSSDKLKSQLTDFVNKNYTDYTTSDNEYASSKSGLLDEINQAEVATQGGENSSCRPFCVLNGKIPLRGIFRARGLQENVDKMGWSKRVKEYMRQGPGMPGAFIGRWKIVWGIQGKAGGMYAAPTEEAVRLVAEKGTQKDSADFGRRSSRRTTGKVICTPTWRTVKSSMGEYHFFL